MNPNQEKQDVLRTGELGGNEAQAEASKAERVFRHGDLNTGAGAPLGDVLLGHRQRLGTVAPGRETAKRVLSVEQTLRDEMEMHVDIAQESERIARSHDQRASEYRERAEMSRVHVRNLRSALAALGMPE